MIKKIIAGFLFVGLSGIIGNGCDKQSTYTYTKVEVPAGAIETKTLNVYLDKDFDENDKRNINNAISQWNYSLNKYIEIKIVDSEFDMDPDLIKKIQMESMSLMLLKINSFSAFIPEPDIKVNNETLAWTKDVGGREIYLVRDRIKDYQLEGVVMHELGHALGSPHVMNSKSLMFIPYYDENSRCIDKYTMENVAEYQHINASFMNYCTF